jgi:hypothetical protein
LRNRKEEVKTRNFNIVTNQADTEPKFTGYQKPPTVDYSKIRVGMKTVDDAIIKIGDLKKVNPQFADKFFVHKAITTYDLKTMREISEFYFRINGIYARIIRYMAFMYRYDWFLTPLVNDKEVKKEKILKGYADCLKVLDSYGVKKSLGEIAQKVLIFGAYYGYKVETQDGVVLQELPVNYCRSRFNSGKKPAVEFNMRYFDDNFKDTVQRMRVLKVFPPEFAKGYALYKQGKLPPEFSGDTSGWYMLDPEATVRFTANGYEHPAFMSVIPLIIDLDEAQALDKKKTLQRLLKLVIQQLPLDKDGTMIFDPEEVQQLHNNAVAMLGRAIGVDVLTTFADVEVANMDASRAETQSDDLVRVERQVYNEAGVSQMQFNTDGNIALEKSILNDEAFLYNMLLQFEEFLNDLIGKYNKSKNKIEYRVQLLTTTIYNYKELAKLYKEQTQLGYSKFLPQIALGQSQSSILANAYFENDVLDLVNVFIPPMMSSTMNADILNRNKGGNAAGGGTNPTKTQDPAKEQEGAGRKELPDDQKSEKTLKNLEAKG